MSTSCKYKTQDDELHNQEQEQEIGRLFQSAEPKRGDVPLSDDPVHDGPAYPNCSPAELANS